MLEGLDLLQILFYFITLGLIVIRLLERRTLWLQLLAAALIGIAAACYTTNFEQPVHLTLILAFIYAFILSWYKSFELLLRRWISIEGFSIQRKLALGLLALVVLYYALIILSMTDITKLYIFKLPDFLFISHGMIILAILLGRAYSYARAHIAGQGRRALPPLASYGLIALIIGACELGGLDLWLNHSYNRPFRLQLIAELRAQGTTESIDNYQGEFEFQGERIALAGNGVAFYVDDVTPFLSFVRMYSELVFDPDDQLKELYQGPSVFHSYDTLCKFRSDMRVAGKIEQIEPGWYRVECR